MGEKEYIERGALLKVIRRMDGVGGMAVLDREEVEDAINNPPAADVVEVVRCKDCIYNNGACTHSEIYDDTNYNPDYYCADGKRKEQNGV